MDCLKHKKIGITHSGRFHTDDVLSTAFLKYFNPEIEILRVTSYERECNDDEIVYDIGFGEFDHHQEKRLIDDKGNPYCAFGLLWEKYGRDYLKNNNFVNIEKAFKLFKSEYVYKINEGDNSGYKNVKDFYENMLILSCNPMWFEETEDKEMLLRKQFDKAIKIGTALLKNWTRNIYKLTGEFNNLGE